MATATKKKTISFEFPSTKGSATWVSTLYEDGTWFCTCPSCRYQKNVHPDDRSCKHIRKAKMALSMANGTLTVKTASPVWS